MKIEQAMQRRMFIGAGASILMVPAINHLLAVEPFESAFEEASRILSDATSSSQVRAASIYVRDGGKVQSRGFGAAADPNAAFLLGSISKPIAMTALMTLYDEGLFALDDPVQKFIPEFQGNGRERVTIRHILTHTSGLPDQLPNNAELRASHARLSAFVAGTMEVPLAFSPGENYEYSSMGIMLGAEIAQRLSGVDIKQLVHDRVFAPLRLDHSALGMGSLDPQNVMPAQVEFGAVESGAGSTESQNWNWNSSYWRNLGAPWGGVQASATDVGRFLDDMMSDADTILRPATKRLMTRNHNPPSLESRGLAFDVDMRHYAPESSEASFGHTGSTGTIAWADRALDRVCVVLTTLPAPATNPDDHPRYKASLVIGSSRSRR